MIEKNQVTATNDSARSEVYVSGSELVNSPELLSKCSQRTLCLRQPLPRKCHALLSHVGGFAAKVRGPAALSTG